MILCHLRELFFLQKLVNRVQLYPSSTSLRAPATELQLQSSFAICRIACLSSDARPPLCYTSQQMYALTAHLSFGKSQIKAPRSLPNHVLVFVSSVAIRRFTRPPIPCPPHFSPKLGSFTLQNLTPAAPQKKTPRCKRWNSRAVMPEAWESERCLRTSFYPKGGQRGPPPMR